MVKRVAHRLARRAGWRARAAGCSRKPPSASRVRRSATPEVARGGRLRAHRELVVALAQVLRAARSCAPCRSGSPARTRSRRGCAGCPPWPGARSTRARRGPPGRPARCRCAEAPALEIQEARRAFGEGLERHGRLVRGERRQGGLARESRAGSKPRVYCTVSLPALTHDDRVLALGQGRRLHGGPAVHRSAPGRCRPRPRPGAAPARSTVTGTETVSPGPLRDEQGLAWGRGAACAG